MGTRIFPLGLCSKSASPSKAHPLNKAKETKNKVVYGTADGSVIQSVYIDRDALEAEPPEAIKVVISSE